MRPLEFNMTMGRTQDVTPIKHAEDARPMTEQQQLTHINEKARDIRQEQVYRKNDDDMDSQYDAAKGNGKGTGYQENNRKKQKTKQEEDGKVTVKSRASFDVKI